MIGQDLVKLGIILTALNFTSEVKNALEKFPLVQQTCAGMFLRALLTCVKNTNN